MNARNRHKTEFFAHMEKHAPENRRTLQIIVDVDRLFSYAATLARIAVETCNGYDREYGRGNWQYDHQREEFNARKEEKTRERATELLDKYGLQPNFGGDPRGYVFKVYGLPGNTWGGDEEGYGIG